MTDMAEQASKGAPRFELRHRLSLALEVGGVEPAEMADELGISETTIRNYRSGRTVPSRSALRVWALRCGVPFHWLATGEDDSTDPDRGSEQDVSLTKWSDDRGGTVLPFRCAA
jgi:transcriptional regulator with XRE-family HTH domain